MDRRQLLAAAGGFAGSWALGGPCLAAGPWTSFERVDAAMVLPVEINGLITKGIFDSGASVTAVTPQVADAAGLKPGGDVRINTWEGASTGGQITAPHPFRFAGLRGMARSVVVDWGDTGPPVGVLIGRSWFPGQIFEIDYSGKRLRILPRSQFTPPPGYNAITRPNTSGRRGANPTLAPLQIEGHAVMAKLDLGQSSALSVSGPVAQRWRLLEGRRVSEGLDGSLAGLTTTKRLSVVSVSLAGQTFQDVPVIVVDQSPDDAVIGTDLIDRFGMFLAMDTLEIWLKPIPAEASRPFRRNRSGLALLPVDGGTRVAFVAPGSPAEAAGWKVDERVVSIDGRPAQSVSRSWSFEPASSRHVLKLQSGEERTLVLADYY